MPQSFLALRGSSVVKNLPASAGDSGLNPGSGRSLQDKMATHSNILAWEIPRTEETGGLESMESQRVGHGLATEHAQSFLKGSVGILRCCYPQRIVSQSVVMQGASWSSSICKYLLLNNEGRKEKVRILCWSPWPDPEMVWLLVLLNKIKQLSRDPQPPPPLLQPPLPFNN